MKGGAGQIRIELEDRIAAETRVKVLNEIIRELRAIDHNTRAGTADLSDSTALMFLRETLDGYMSALIDRRNESLIEALEVVGEKGESCEK
jgi:hypothetical protein